MFHDDEGIRTHRRLPGLYRRWEVAELLQAGHDYRVEDAGETIDGTPLLAVYAADTVEGSR
jgi:uncharacterized protein YerC